MYPPQARARNTIKVFATIRTFSRDLPSSTYLNRAKVHILIVEVGTLHQARKMAFSERQPVREQNSSVCRWRSTRERGQKTQPLL